MKKNIPYQIHLSENEMPRQWYNIMADMKEMPEPALSPVTKKPATFEELKQIFPAALLQQEMTTERYIDIPEEVIEKYKMYRTTPLHRAYNLEKLLKTPARLYYKYEGQNPSGSHKLNTAIPQVYYNKLEGIKRLSTETGAGQWGTALSTACSFYGLDCTVYMVRISYEQKPYRKTLMQTFGATVYSSPSVHTECGRKVLAETPDTTGSLGIAISEAVEDAVTHDDTNYALGSVLNHVILHQTIIGQEAVLQMEKIDENPDIVIGCNGGGSNFSGFAFPFLKDKLNGKSNARFIAVEPLACPKLTKGVYTYDYGDTAGMAPIAKMYTLGHKFMPPGIHAGGLRYHGDSPLLSKLYHDGYVEASAVAQEDVFKAAIDFAKTEAILPAPESAHAICQAVAEAVKCKETGEEKVILFNVSGHGYLDMAAYENYLSGKLAAEISIDEEIEKSLKQVPKI